VQNRYETVDFNLDVAKGRTLVPAIRIAVAGAQGHMGRALLAAVAAAPAFSLVGGFGRPEKVVDGLIDVDAALRAADVVVDFTTGQASAALAEKCAAMGRPAMVIGATGFEDTHLARIAEAARKIAIVRSGNFSLGVNMLVGLVERAARSFPAEVWDIEVHEAHHRRKIDAPSGTALMLGEAAASGRGVPLAPVERRGRDGIIGERALGEIGFSVLRGGGIIGEHSVVFAADEEILTLSHSALDRGMFARGALTAARWVSDHEPGEYDMQDVLGLSPISR
jgi:4-hydroxy-tetrahydrodipicolinate reductase